MDINRLLTKLVSLPGDTEDELKSKKNFIVSITITLVIVTVLSMITWSLQLPVMTQCGIGYISTYALTFTVFVAVKRVVHWFLFINQFFVLILTSITIIRLGGIPYSGGLIFVGMATVVYSMAFPTKRMALWLFCIYIATSLLESILFPWFPTDHELSPTLNFIFFGINTIWISIFILYNVFYIFAQRAELEKAKSDRLQEIDHLKTRLFINIAHEFRTPLTIISGMTEMIRENPDEQYEERTGLIMRSSKQILRLVDQMLNLARLEAGSMPLHMIRSDIVAFLRMLTGSYSGLFAYRNVRLHYLSECTSLVMDFDPEKMEEIVGNLLTNALKFTTAQGDVYLSIREDTDKKAIIRVRDTGTGIPGEHLSAIFERFYRAGNDLSSNEEGTGIGLALVREYTRLMGGDVTVKSEPGEGAEFTVILPVSRIAPVKEDFPELFPAASEWNMSGQIPSFSTEALGQLPHLLIIEDNSDVIQYLIQVLQKTFRLDIAIDGNEGINKALGTIPDIILSDIMMPGIDGFELCRTLKQDFRTSHIPIVFLTARADQESRIEGLEYGADAYLVKPFNKRELLICLSNLFINREKLRLRYHTLIDEPLKPVTNPDERFIQKINSLLENNFSNDRFGIKALCTSMEISRVQLHRKLIAITGQPASHYIRSFRLAKARKQLTGTSKTVAEIAYETGFSDPNYFSRVFSLEYGQTPTEIRKTVKTGK